MCNKKGQHHWVYHMTNTFSVLRSLCHTPQMTVFSARLAVYPMKYLKSVVKTCQNHKPWRPLHHRIPLKWARMGKVSMISCEQMAWLEFKTNANIRWFGGSNTHSEMDFQQGSLLMLDIPPWPWRGPPWFFACVPQPTPGPKSLMARLPCECSEHSAGELGSAASKLLSSEENRGEGGDDRPFEKHDNSL